MAAAKKNFHSENRNYYIAMACILAIVIIVFITSSQSKHMTNTATQVDVAGQAYYIAESPESVEEIMARQAAAGHMQKVYVDQPATAYAYLRND